MIGEWQVDRECGGADALEPLLNERTRLVRCTLRVPT